MRRIALLGAGGSGKTWLAGQLARAFADMGENLQIDDGLALPPSPPLPALTHVAVLLLGLDLAPPTQAQLNADQALRQALISAGTPFQVIYGQGQARLASALQALNAEASSHPQAQPEDKVPAPSEARAAKRKPWVWACDKCSDPVCEHRLLSDLLAKR